MHLSNVVRSQRRARTVTPALVVLAALLLSLLLGQAAWATTTTVPADSTTTTVEPTPAEAATTSGLTPPPAGFQTPNPGLIAADLGVQFWPEYDSNDVLVLLDITRPATTVVPYQFTFFIPKGARLAGIAEIDANGQFDYSLGQPTIVSGDTMDAVTVTVPKSYVLRLEYYYDPGVGDPGAKAYTLSFQVPADAGRLAVALQEPLGASDFSPGPFLPQVATDPSGSTVHYGEIIAPKAGEILEFPVSYTRTDSEPSIPTGPPGSDSATQQSSSYLLWLLVILVVAVGGIVVYRLFLRRPAAAPARGSAGARPARGGGGQQRGVSAQGGAQRGGKRPSRPVDADTPAGPARFCTQCGGRLSKKDRFCPSCGAERDQ